jgi:Fe-S cluster assembly protein SufD
MSSNVSLDHPLMAAEFANYLLQQSFPQRLIKDQPNSDQLQMIDWLQNWQNLNSDRLLQIPFPTVRQEEWKYTDVSSLLRFPWQLLIPTELNLESIELKQLISAHVLPEASHSHLVFVNGIFAPNFSNIERLPASIIATSLNTAIRSGLDCDRINQLVQKHLASDSQDYFAILNNACFQDLAIVSIPSQIIVDVPLQILFVQHNVAKSSNAKDNQKVAIAHNRCLIVAGENSELNLVQTDVGFDEQAYLANSVIQIWLKANAKVSHSQLQQQGNQSYQIRTTQVFQAKASSYSSQEICLGAKLSRHNFQIQQQGEGSNTELDGLAMIGDQQLADTHSVIAHKFANGTSRQMHKSVVSDRAHAVFSGKIEVAKDAQMTNSSQLSRNLLLSPQAKVETQPQLEILADNVKCAHGATVSQLEQEEIFYLQSRGIDAARAVNLLTFGFASEVIAKIPIVSLRESLNQYVLSQVQSRDLD